MKTVKLTVELTNVPDNFDEEAFIENAADSDYPQIGYAFSAAVSEVSDVDEKEMIDNHFGVEIKKDMGELKFDTGETFDFSEALRRMKERKKVHRKDEWNYYTVDEGKVKMGHDGESLERWMPQNFPFNYEDILATDWKEVKQ